VIVATVNVKLIPMEADPSGEAAVRRFTADEAIRMVEEGIVGEDEHYELLEGKLVDADPTTGDEIIRRFTGDEAIRLVETGIVGEDEHVELLEGALVEMSPQGPEHASAISMLADRLRETYRGRAHVREEKPVSIGPYSLPEPDIAVVRGNTKNYARRHPVGAECILVVETAFSSQRIDRRKGRIYAAGGVEVYWLIDVVGRKLELWTAPVDGAYRVIRTLDADDVVELPESSERWLVRELFV
jgi:Uma2 family endonuclease